MQAGTDDVVGELWGKKQILNSAAGKITYPEKQ